MSEHRYRPSRRPGPDEVDAALLADDVPALRDLVVEVAAAGDDPDRAADLLRRLLSHPDEIVRGNAVLGVGYLARRFRSVPPDLLTGVERAADDASDYVRDHASSAADDVEVYLGLDVRTGSGAPDAE